MVGRTATTPASVSTTPAGRRSNHHTVCSHEGRKRTAGSISLTRTTRRFSLPQNENSHSKVATFTFRAEYRASAYFSDGMHRSIIGAGLLNGPVRDGKECFQSAWDTRNSTLKYLQ